MLKLTQEQQRHFAAAVRQTIAETRVWLRRARVSREGTVLGITNRLTDAARKQRILAAWLTNEMVVAVFTDYLNPKVRHIETNGSGKPLAELVEGGDVDAWSRELSALLMTLPWAYEAWLETPLQDPPAGRVELANDCEIVGLSQEESSAISLHDVDESNSRYYHRYYPSRLSHEHVHFVSRFDGYVRQTDRTPELDEVMNGYKGLLGLLVADGVLSFELFPDHTPPRVRPIVLYRLHDDGQRELLPYEWMTQEDTWLVRDLRHLGRSRHTPADSIEAVRAAFRDLPTRTAARWYLDSFGRPSGLIQIVQATVALEILLGDDEESKDSGLATLLANRLAYLTGRTPTHRQEIIAEFKRLYNLRSRIVHAGKHRLDDDERLALRQLQRHMQGALQAEIGGFRTDEEYRGSR